MSAPSPASGAPAPDAHQLVPQAWLDRVTQVEAAAEDLFAAVVDALQATQQGTARLDPSLVALLDSRSHALIQALHLPRPSLDRPATATDPTKREPEA